MKNRLKIYINPKIKSDSPTIGQLHLLLKSIAFSTSCSYYSSVNRINSTLTLNFDTSSSLTLVTSEGVGKKKIKSDAGKRTF